MKKIVSIIVFVVLIAAIPITVLYNNQQKEIRSQAAPSTTLSFSPSSVIRQTNETFLLAVSIDTGSNTVSAAKLVVNADGTNVKIIGITAGTFLSNTIVPPSFTETKASITLGSPPALPIQGIGILATVLFQVIGTSGTSQVTFTGSQAAGIGEQTNVLSQSIPAVISISEFVNTPTPTQVITQNTPTPTQVITQNTPTPTQVITQNTPTPTQNVVTSETKRLPPPVTGSFEPFVLIPILSAISIIVLAFAL
ncbi:MAG: cohesin domain-containing protein [Patescibacteria group bacterium]